MCGAATGGDQRAVLWIYGSPKSFLEDLCLKWWCEQHIEFLHCATACKGNLSKFWTRYLLFLKWYKSFITLPYCLHSIFSPTYSMCIILLLLTALWSKMQKSWWKISSFYFSCLCFRGGDRSEGAGLSARPGRAELSKVWGARPNSPACGQGEHDGPKPAE